MDCREYFFDSQVQVGAKFAGDVPDSEIKNEPMFFNASLQFAYENGGPITRSFIANLPAVLWDKAVFDSRVHMLMPGWYPAIPGFHHDDVPRPPIPVGQHFGTAGQPDYDNPRYHSQHILGLVNAEVCPTEFAVGSCCMPGVSGDSVIYREWHPVVERLLADGKLDRFSCPDRHLVRFDWQSFHTGTKAVKSGWRWFGRVSWDTERANTITNEIRRQAQVYLEFPMAGW